MSPQINVCFYVHHLYTVCADWLLKTCYFGRNIREHYLRIYFISSCYFWLKNKQINKNNAPVQLKDSWLFVLFKKNHLSESGCKNLPGGVLTTEMRHWRWKALTFTFPSSTEKVFVWITTLLLLFFFSSGSDTKVAGKHSATYKYDNTMFATAYLVFTIEFDKQFLTF